MNIFMLAMPARFLAMLARILITILSGHEEKHFHVSPSVNRFLTRRFALCPHKKENHDVSSHFRLKIPTDRLPIHDF
jgi:hypothetical protein